MQARTIDHVRQLATQALNPPPVAFLEQQASVLAMQDAFFLTTIMVVVACVATLFVREKRHHW